MKIKKKRLLQPLSFLGTILAICMMTIGYSAYNANLTISGEAAIKVNDNISIVDLNISSLENGAYEDYNSRFGVKTIDYYISLPNANSTITYKLDIQNKTNRDYGIAQVEGLPDNLTYEIINYNLGDKLCTNSICNNNQIDEIYLKISYKTNEYDSDNVNFSGRMKINFEYFYDIIYQNVANSNTLKQKVMKGTAYQEVIPIPTDYKLKVRMNGLLLVKDTNYTYDDDTNTLTIPDVIANVVISIKEIGTEFDLTGTGGGNRFSYLNTGYDINEQTFYLEADLSDIDLSSAVDNIISIGNDFGNWEVKNQPYGVNLHVYFPAEVNKTNITVDVTYLTTTKVKGYAKFQKLLDLSRIGLFRLAFNTNGLYINGEKIFDESGKGDNVNFSQNNLVSFLTTYFDIWRTTDLNVDIGSIEGDNRSDANYNEIKIYDKLLTTQELIDLTKIRDEEMPVEEEVSFSYVSSVAIGNNPATTITYPFQPNNNKFIFTNPIFTNLNEKSLYLEMDVSNLKQDALLENLISIGNDFSAWTGPNVYDFHVYYPYTKNSNTLAIALLNGSSSHSQFRKDISLIDNKFIKMLINNNGIYINGEKWFDPTGFIRSGINIFGNSGSGSTAVSEFFNNFIDPDNNISFIYGSVQGDNRSSATYNDIRIYNGTLSEVKSITLTS